jgi:hypothetical protein
MSISRRSSSVIGMFKYIKPIPKSRSNTELDYEYVKNIPYLIIVIINPDRLFKLINLLLIENGEYALKLRFCSCVLDYERTCDTESNNNKKKSIISIFIDTDGLFRLKCISEEKRQTVVQTPSLISKIKDDIIENLLKDDIIIEKLNILKNT